MNWLKWLFTGHRKAVTQKQRIEELRQTVLELSQAITLIHAKEQSVTQLRTELESLRTQMQDVRELREMMRDPKRLPIVARTGAHFRSIMEEEKN
jgi:septal ring factor EnvC (AmiA/AmiB activator)